MKQIFSCLLALLLIGSAALLVSCGGTGGDNPEGDGSATEYEVTAPASALYSFGWHTIKATAGTEAYAVVEPSYSAVIIEMVYYNGQPCEKDAEEENRFNYIMPAENVTLTVETGFIDTPQSDDTRGFLAWDSGNETSFVAGEGTAELAFTTDWGYTSLVKVEECLSSDQTVIPNDALELSYRNGNGSMIVGGSVKIDLAKVHAGTAQIVLALQSSNVSSYNGCIVCTVTVKEAEPIVPVETWDVTVEFQPFSVETDGLCIAFTDLDHQENTDAKQVQTFFDPNDPRDLSKWELTQGGMITLTLAYVPQHRYTVRLVYNDGTGKEVSVSEATLQENAAYRNEELTFAAEGGSIRFSLSAF